MKNFLLFAVVCVAASAAPLTIYNTGQDNSHVGLAPGFTDPHFTSISPPVGTSSVFVLGQSASIPGSWLANNATSEWVGPDTGDGSSFNGGNYGPLVYRTTVNLTGYDPTSAVIVGRWATDNSGNNILLNGASTGNTSNSFSSWSTFTLSSGFTSGVNNLDFSWSNAGGPGGVRVEFTSATANLLATTPEPTSYLLMGAGLAALGFFRRKR